ncbi:MAG: PAS domain S-box protein [Cyanobacteria bacterium SZAS-4]|nr:PAS domain S-box protein [Cyanobacteria bacterium SZAS-4]
MKLKTQGLIVIFFPVAFQLLLVATLSCLIVQAQADAERSIHSEKVINECNLIVARVFDGVGAFIMSHTGKDEQILGPTVSDAKEEFDKQVQQLQILIKTDPEQAENAKTLSKQASDVSDLSYHRHPWGQASTSVTSMRLLKALSAIINTEGKKIEGEAQAKTQQRNNMKIFLLCFAVFGIVISAIVALICALRLKKLVAHITENTSRFSRREPLLQVMEGSDEVARVDQVIHAMDHSVEDVLSKGRALIDNAADLVCSIDRDGYFQSANRFSRRLLGVDPDKLLNTSVIDLVIAEDCVTADEQINKSFNSILGNHFDVRLKTSDDRIVETSWSTFFSQQDNSLFCVIGDVTERKNIERLKQDFIGMISHDLRTPLMSIASSIALVQSGALGGCSEAVLKDLVGAEKTVDRLIAMINDLLDFEKMEAGKMQFNIAPVDMNDVVADAFREVKAVAEAKQIRLETENTSISVMGDREKLMQMLINLLANAIRYSPEGAPVTVQCTAKYDAVEVAVKDEGPGVPEGFHESVFAPFENAPGSKETNEGGTGLGLAICKLIIEGHNGEIGVRNRQGRGSEFWFTLTPAR